MVVQPRQVLVRLAVDANPNKKVLHFQHDLHIIFLETEYKLGELLLAAERCSGTT